MSTISLLTLQDNTQKGGELNQQPLRIDFLVIKKSKNTIIKNEIGRFFLGHNLMEYKSADDQINIDTLFKVIAYGCLYKAYAKEIDGISADDITLTLIRKRKPVKLFSYLQTHGVSLETTGEGIYVVRGYCPFPIQFIILRELNEAVRENTKNVTQDMILRMLEKGKYDYDEIAEIAGTSVETVKKMAKSAVIVPK